MSVYPPLPAEQTTDLKISFRLGEGAPYINCKGEIAYTIADRGSGVVFTEISEYHRDQITEHFEKQVAPKQP